MTFTGKYLSFAAVLLAALLVCSCRREQPVDVIQGKGCIVLSLAADDLITCDTKAAVDLSGVMGAMTFTVSGTRSDGQTVSGLTIDFDGYSAIIESGTYTLTAEYTPDGAESGMGMMCFSGQSVEFTVYPGRQADVSVSMTVCNSKVKVVADDSFTAFYSDVRVEFTSPRSVSAQLGQEVFLRSGEITFNLTATALDNTSAGGKNLNLENQKITLPEGTSHTITLKAAPNGSIIFTSSTTETSDDLWDGEFS